MKDELLLTILVLGFLRLKPSLTATVINRGLPSPKAGAFPGVLVPNGGGPRPSLAVSLEFLDSLSLSLML